MYSIHPLPPPLPPPPPPLYHHHFPALKPLLAELEVVEILIADLSRTFQTLITETLLLPPIRLEVRYVGLSDEYSIVTQSYYLFCVMFRIPSHQPSGRLGEQLTLPGTEIPGDE